MPFQFFPEQEYWLNSKYPPAECAEVLDKSVMERQTVTIDFISALIDRKLGIYRYFEGDVIELNFKINHKHYTAGGFKFQTAIPMISGVIKHTDGGSEIHVTSRASSGKYFIARMFLYYLPICFLPFFSEFRLFFFGAILSVLSLVVGLLTRRAFYLRRTKKDKGQLKIILKANETEYDLSKNR